MKFELEVRRSGPNERSHKRQVELERTTAGWNVRLDGEPITADVAQISQYSFSILLNGTSFRVCVTPQLDSLKVQEGPREFLARISDPRAWRGRSAAFEAEGQQNVTAAMPGKVVRVLVGPGDAVQAGQGVLVVEAMKMQNELRSPKSGTVRRLLISEGDAVTAGQILLSIE